MLTRSLGKKPAWCQAGAKRTELSKLGRGVFIPHPHRVGESRYSGYPECSQVG